MLRCAQHDKLARRVIRERAHAHPEIKYLSYWTTPSFSITTDVVCINQRSLQPTLSLALKGAGPPAVRARIDDPVFPHAGILIFSELIIVIAGDALLRDDLDHEIGQIIEHLPTQALVVYPRDEHHVGFTYRPTWRSVHGVLRTMPSP